MSGGTACFQVARLAGGCCACADSCLASGKLVLSYKIQVLEAYPWTGKKEARKIRKAIDSLCKLLYK